MKNINPNRILFEDEHLLAVNKLSRELVVRGKGKLEKLPLLDFLKGQYGHDLAPLHRLDFETSGVVLFAKTKECFDAAITQKKFFAPTVEKTYRAIVMGLIKNNTGVIDKELETRHTKELVAAKTEYKVLKLFGDTSYVEATIHSGKHHQIRKHFASINHPLVNDDMYGNAKFNRMFYKVFRFKYFFLHAAKLSFNHFITNEPIVLEAPLPPNFETVLKELGKK